MTPYRRGTILLVEDNELVTWAVEDDLTHAGWAFLSVPTGDAAIAELELDAGRFIALLTDIQMPGHADGWDVARKSREIVPTIPVC